MQVQLTTVSHNEKTGPIPVSTTSRDSCPKTCPFLNMGCYARLGPIKWNWDKVTTGERGTDWNTFCTKVKRMPRGQLWRHNQAGDLPGDGYTIDGELLEKLVVANAGKRGFTYTHYLPQNAINSNLIASANFNGFTVNLSANNIQEADDYKALNIAPVVTVVPHDTRENFTTPAGNKVVICPATTGEYVTCASCQMCQKRDRSFIIGFPAHGLQKRKVSEISKGGEL